MSKRISLTRYLVEKQRVDGHIPAQLRLLLGAEETASERTLRVRARLGAPSYQINR